MSDLFGWLTSRWRWPHVSSLIGIPAIQAWILRGTAESTLEDSWGKFHSLGFGGVPLSGSFSWFPFCPLMELNIISHPAGSLFIFSGLNNPVLPQPFFKGSFQGPPLFWLQRPRCYPQKLVTHVSSSVASTFCMPFDSAPLLLGIYLDLAIGICIKCISLLYHTEKW